jgi:hypothetical protein
VTQMRERRLISLGFRVHSGWAVMIAFDGNEVVERRRIELAADGMPVQPYHVAEALAFTEAETLIARCEEITRRLAIAALERLDVNGVRAACVLASSARPLPDLASVLTSHALIHTAEGAMYRDAIRHAAMRLGIPLVAAKEKEVFAHLPAETRRRIERYGKILGPPWRQDEKLATAAAYVAHIADLSRATET